MMASKKKTFWTAQDDEILYQMVKEFGTKKWSKIADILTQKSPQNPKNGKQCRQRWINKLNPMIKKRSWQQEECYRLMCLHQKYGNQWTMIAEQLPGRTYNSVKNKFYSILRKNLRDILKICGYKKNTEKIKKIKTSLLCDIIASNSKGFQSEMQSQNEEEFDLGMNWIEVGEQFYHTLSKIEKMQSELNKVLLERFYQKLKSGVVLTAQKRQIQVLREMLLIYNTLKQAKIIDKNSDQSESSPNPKALSQQGEEQYENGLDEIVLGVGQYTGDGESIFDVIDQRFFTSLPENQEGNNS